MLAVLGTIRKVIPELYEQMFQLACFEHWLKAGMKLLYHLKIHFASMSKIPVQFRGKEKPQLCRRSSQPRLTIPFNRWSIECAVDLYTIHEAAYIFKLVDP